MKGIMIIVLFLLGLFGGVIGKAIPENADEGKTAFTLEEVLGLTTRGFSYSWKSANEIVYKNGTRDDIIVYDFKESKVFIEGVILKKYKATSYYLSPDNKYLLLGHSMKKKFRHSFTEKYVIYSLEDKKYTELADNADLDHAMWAPNSKRIIYVKDNNIYSMELKEKKVFQITTNGIPGVIFNGIADWVYEAGRNDFPEEVLGTGQSIEMSPDGQQMVYISIDGRNVTEAVFMQYGKPGDIKNQYAQEVRIKYPKVGTNISIYSLYHFNFTDSSTKLISGYKEGRELLYGYTWITNAILAVSYSNRVQNITEIDLCDIIQGKCKKVTEDRNPKGWSVLSLPVFSSKGDRYLWRKRQPVGDGEYYHLHLIKTDGSGSIILTNGTFMVRAIDGWDEVNRVVYYRASELGKPSTDHIYAVSESGKEPPICVTCQLTDPDGNPCLIGSISFSSDYKYAIGHCSGPIVPFYASFIYTSVKQLKLVEFLEMNYKLKKFLTMKLQPKIINVQVPVAKRIEADARLYLPPNIDMSGKTKYPMIIYVYGGPDNPQVTDKFRHDWSLYLTTNRSIIYGIIDGRGTGRKGTEMMYSIYRSFGTTEIQDQITATKYLHDKFDFIDKNRTGIWGWSYGGYATTKVLENDVGGVFKCGVAGAPVTDWIYYNSAYTERYMDLPSENPKAYKESSTLYNVENLRNKKYLLIHGTGDDNVHYQNAMALAKILQERNIMFEQASYPDEDHGFVGTSRIHMMFTIDKFFKECFGLNY